MGLILFRLKLFIAFLFLFSSLHAYAGVYTEKLWNKKELTTCFSQKTIDIRETLLGSMKPVSFTVIPWSDEDKLMLKETVTSEYTPERTGIHFVGWEDCHDGMEVDVVLFFVKEKNWFQSILGDRHGFLGSAPVGFDPRQLRNYMFASDITLVGKNSLRGAALHEFAHVAGLDHEFLHPEAAAREPSCKYNVLNAKYAAIAGGPRRWTEYDAKSIMSYCEGERARNQNKLSEGDVHLLKSLYP